MTHGVETWEATSQTRVGAPFRSLRQQVGKSWVLSQIRRRDGELAVGIFTTERLIAWRNRRVVGRVAHRLLRVLNGVEVPSAVVIGEDLVTHHEAFGSVVHPNTTIGDRVHLFHGVTIGRGEALWERGEGFPGSIVIEDDVWLLTGATVLAGDGELRVGRGTVVGANSILRSSTGPWEIWAGTPARCIGRRKPSVWLRPRDRDPATGECVVWLDDPAP